MERLLQRLEEQLLTPSTQATDKESKQVDLGTSKLNCLDPQISITWYLGPSLVLCHGQHGSFLCWGPTDRCV